MEIRLTFIEPEIRKIYYENFNNINNRLNERIKSRKTTSLILVGLSLFFFSLTYFHEDWVLYGFVIGSISILFTLWTYFPVIKSRRRIEKEKIEVEEFINRYKSITGIKYTYDDTVIRYFEFENFVFESLIENIQNINKDEKWIYITFRNPKENIWIPKITVDENDFNVFSQAMEEGYKLNNGIKG